MNMTSKSTPNISGSVIFAIMIATASFNVSAGTSIAKAKLTQTFNVNDYRSLIERSSIRTIENYAKDNTFGYRIKMTSDKKSITTTRIDSATHKADSCEISLDAKENLMNARYFEHLSLAEAHDFIFIHEQVHCADFSQIFNDVEHYNQMYSFAEDVYPPFKYVASESFADSYTLLLMSAKDPSSADRFYKDILNFRELENTRRFDEKEFNDHDTRFSLMHTMRAWQQLDGKALTKMMADPAQRVIVEQELAKLAAVVTHNGVQDYINLLAKKFPDHIGNRLNSASDVNGVMRKELSVETSAQQMMASVLDASDKVIMRQIRKPSESALTSMRAKSKNIDLKPL